MFEILLVVCFIGVFVFMFACSWQSLNCCFCSLQVCLFMRFIGVVVDMFAFPVAASLVVFIRLVVRMAYCLFWLWDCLLWLRACLLWLRDCLSSLCIGEKIDCSHDILLVWLAGLLVLSVCLLHWFQDCLLFLNIG